MPTKTIRVPVGDEDWVKARQRALADRVSLGAVIAEAVVAYAHGHTAESTERPVAKAVSTQWVTPPPRCAKCNRCRGFDPQPHATKMCRCNHPVDAHDIMLHPELRGGQP